MAKEEITTKDIIILSGIGLAAWFLFSKKETAATELGGSGSGTSVYEIVRDTGYNIKETITNVRDILGGVAKIPEAVTGDIATGTKYLGAAAQISGSYFAGVEPMAVMRSKIISTSPKGTLLTGNFPFGLGGLSGISFIPFLGSQKQLPIDVAAQSAKRAEETTTPAVSTTKSTITEKATSSGGGGIVAKTVTAAQHKLYESMGLQGYSTPFGIVYK